CNPSGWDYSSSSILTEPCSHIYKQTNFGYGLVALITACGEQIFSSVAFKCPCNELNFIYGLVFLLMPALALLLLGIILSKKTWKLTTGFCHRNSKLCNWRNLKSMGVTVFQISASALVAPSTWIAVALLHGSYYECAMTGANSTSYTEVVCRGVNFEAKCVTELQTQSLVVIHRYSPQRGFQKILGWLVIASIMISNLLMICVAHCFSPISYLQHVRSLSRHVRSLSRHVRSLSRHVCSPIRHVRSPSRHVRLLSRHVRSPSRHVQSPNRHVRSPSRHVQSPNRYVQSPSRHVQLPSRHVQSPSRDI
uniref:Calcium homeostasis modulator family member 6 n=1 Tax=Oryzias latipes TaxID=8090 RepID=A0A3B3HGB6_ORYLA